MTTAEQIREQASLLHASNTTAVTALVQLAEELETASAPRHLMFEYKVVSKFSFPMDMLRYDQCWPASTEDAANVDLSLARDSGVVEIALRSHQRPTIARWDSFMWTVVSHSLREV